MTTKDVFLSYSSNDRAFAERLANDLAAAGVRVWWDREEIKVGDSITQRIQEGISTSAWLAIVLSPSAVASPWVERELSAALVRELEQKDVFVLPVLYQPCSIPVFLRDKRYADFTTSYAAGLGALLERLAAPVSPRLLRALLSDDATTILSAHASIPAANRPHYHKLLIAKLSDPSVADTERLAAAAALFKIRFKGLDSHLLALARTGTTTVRRRALFYLGELKARQAIALVSECLSDESPDVRAAARTAYRKITGRRA